MKKNYIKPLIKTWRVEPSALMQMSMGGEYRGNLGSAHIPALDEEGF